MDELSEIIQGTREGLQVLLSVLDYRRAHIFMVSYTCIRTCKGKCMKRKWMPIVAGILEILAGFGMLASAYFFLVLMYIEALWPLPLKYFLSLFVPSLGILSMVGGVFALMRRKWRLAFVGAVATIPLPLMALSGLARWSQHVHNIPELYSFIVVLLLSVSIIALLVLSKRAFKS